MMQQDRVIKIKIKKNNCSCFLATNLNQMKCMLEYMSNTTLEKPAESKVEANAFFMLLFSTFTWMLKSPTSTI